MVRFISKAVVTSRRKLFLGLSLLINLGLLGYFKYADFFVENLNIFLGALGIKALVLPGVLLPIGISFFTFQSITYSVDVYRNIHRPFDQLKDYLLYILMFPQLIAGPIIRFHEIADQILDRSRYDTTVNRLSGSYQFVLGLAKKVLLANTIGSGVDIVFNAPVDEISAMAAWLGMIGYSMQIYFDFSGYSDMAIGLGRMMGFRFPENFNNPYVSRSITEFWRRWHITLGSWMKSYLYIPLGGNRAGSVRVYFNLWIVFIISGLWHGAAWTFLIWGAYHGLFLMLDKWFLLKYLGKVHPTIRTILTYLVVVFGWVLFRADSFDQALIMYQAMFDWAHPGTAIDFNASYYFYLVLGLIFSFVVLMPSGKKLQDFFYDQEEGHAREPSIRLVVTIALFVLSVSYLLSTGFNPFIYFRF